MTWLVFAAAGRQLAGGSRGGWLLRLAGPSRCDARLQARKPTTKALGIAVDARPLRQSPSFFLSSPHKGARSGSCSDERPHTQQSWEGGAASGQTRPDEQRARQLHACNA